MKAIRVGVTSRSLNYYLADGQHCERSTSNDDKLLNLVMKYAFYLSYEIPEEFI